MDSGHLISNYFYHAPRGGFLTKSFKLSFQHILTQRLILIGRKCDRMSISLKPRLINTTVLDDLLGKLFLG